MSHQLILSVILSFYWSHFNFLGLKEELEEMEIQISQFKTETFACEDSNSQDVGLINIFKPFFETSELAIKEILLIFEQVQKVYKEVKKKLSK